MEIKITVDMKNHLISDVIVAFHYALQLGEEKMIDDGHPLAHIIYDFRNGKPVLLEEKTNDKKN